MRRLLEGFALCFQLQMGSHDKSFASVCFFFFFHVTKPTENILNVPGLAALFYFLLPFRAPDRILGGFEGVVVFWARG